MQITFKLAKRKIHMYCLFAYMINLQVLYFSSWIQVILYHFLSVPKDFFFSIFKFNKHTLYLLYIRVSSHKDYFKSLQFIEFKWYNQLSGSKKYSWNKCHSGRHTVSLSEGNHYNPFLMYRSKKIFFKISMQLYFNIQMALYYTHICHFLPFILFKNLYSFQWLSHNR